MANPTQKIALSSSRDIPFNKLVLSQSNVRHVKSGLSLDDLAESIARRGLIQSLHVRPVLDTSGEETGMFEVPAGGRRYRALDMLVKQKRLAKTAPVPCIVGDAASGVLIDEISLAENVDRAPLHPLDQFRAFQAMRDKGMTEEAIAAAFLIGVNVVKQRLRLATVSPALLEVYADDGMTLETLMAFTVSPDHDRQEQAWEAARSSWQQEPWQIRRMLTETTVRASDKRAAFVGVDAYEAAGGIILRDLFQEDCGGWLQDVALLDRLVTEKLQAFADDIAAEGWKWIETAAQFPYGVSHGLRRLSGTQPALTDEEQAARDALQSEYNRLSEEYESADELPPEVDERFAEIKAELERFDKRPRCYDPTEIGHAGVFVSIDADGTLSVDRGYVRPEDEVPKDGLETLAAVAKYAGPDTDSAIGEPIATCDDPEDDGTSLPDRLLIELSAHRTLALRDAVAENPHIAMTALLHKLVADTFQRWATASALDVYLHPATLPASADGLGDSQSAQSVAERHERWRALIPGDDASLWDWLDALDDDGRMGLLAHCVSHGINALHETAPANSRTSGATQRSTRCQSASERDPGSASNRDPFGSRRMGRWVTARSRRRSVVTQRRSRRLQTRFLKRQLSLPVSMMSQ